jgi:hypothetical protein
LWRTVTFPWKNHALTISITFIKEWMQRLSSIQESVWLPGPEKEGRHAVVFEWESEFGEFGVETVRVSISRLILSTSRLSCEKKNENRIICRWKRSSNYQP